MVPVPVNTTEEIRRIVREEFHRRNRPASINCFERNLTFIRGGARAVNGNINCQTVSSPAASQQPLQLMRPGALGEQVAIKEEEIQAIQVRTAPIND